MIKMRFQLGVMDLYPISANKTVMENNPFFQVKLKERVNAERLHTAVKQSLAEHPLFACTLRYEKGYYLETNEKEFLLICASEENRPLAFGDATNGFLWQMCYLSKFCVYFFVKYRNNDTLKQHKKGEYTFC